MAARSGMSNLITRWRRMVDDAGTAVWSDDSAQELLDLHSTRLAHHPVSPEPWYRPSNTVEYKLYPIGWANLEESASGTARWYVFDGDGDAAPSNTPDYIRGQLTFASDTAGATYYVSGYSFDLDAAAAAAWTERAGMQADAYDFSADGASYSRSQWFKHCMDMAGVYQAKAGSNRNAGNRQIIGLDRADTMRGR